MWVKSAAFALSTAGHVVLVLSQLQLVRVEGATPAALIGRPPVEVVFSPPEDPTFPGLYPRDASDDGPAFERDYSPVTVRHATFDVSRIADRARVLFPFVTPGLSLELFALAPQDDFDRVLKNPLLRSSNGKPPEPPQPLTLDATALQSLIDRSWSRRDRWRALQPILKLAEAHSSDQGDVPLMLRAYGEQNMGQYYEDFHRVARDPRLWTELTLAADHVSFVGFVRQYASAHPGTRAMIDLLFILDKVVEGNRNILATLQSTDPKTQLADTRSQSPEAYALVLELQRYYALELRAKGLQSTDAVSAAYAKVRLEILAGILRTAPSGYRANDARFLTGWIQWKASNAKEALSSWCQLVALPTDVYTIVTRDLLDVLDPSAGSPACSAQQMDATRVRAIDKVLKQEDGRSWDFQYERLRKFGYRLDTF